MSDPDFPPRLGGGPSGGPYSAPPTAGPFPNIDWTKVAATPYRNTQILLDTPEYRQLRKTWSAHLIGAAVSNETFRANPDPSQPNQNVNARMLPSGSWTIRSWEMSQNFERSEVTDLFRLADLTTVANCEELPAQALFPGPTPSGSVNPVGSYFVRRRIPQGSGNWDAFLPDQVSFPGPSDEGLLPTQNFGVHRTAVTNLTIRPDAPVYLRFLAPAGPLSSQDVLLIWYFGGEVPTRWPSFHGIDQSGLPNGGMFCIVFFGDGEAWLFERTNINQWAQVAETGHRWRLAKKFSWAFLGQVPNRQHTMIVVPEGNDTLNLIGTDVSTVYRATPATAGYDSKTQQMTGPGAPIRLDIRADLRIPFQLGTQEYPTTATVFSRIFRFPMRIGAGSTINLQLVPGRDFLLYDGTDSISVDGIYQASNGAQLAGPDAQGNFTTLQQSERGYFARFTLTRTSSGHQAPVLRGFLVKVDGQTLFYVPVAYTGGLTQNVAITGSDIEVDCDSAMATVEDVDLSLANGPGGGDGGLDVHTDFHAEINTTFDQSGRRMRLFDGILIRAPGHRQGKNWTWQYPSRKWKTRQLQFAGMWYRLTQPWQTVWQFYNFAEDPDSAIQPDGHHLPYLVLDIMKLLLQQGGFPPALRNLQGPPDPSGAPTIGPRLFANWRNPGEQFLHPAAKIATALQRFAHDYMGGRLIWDEAAIPLAQWRLVYPPVLNGIYSPVFTFTTDGPPDNGRPRAVHVPGAYPAQTTYVIDYNDWIQKPEANLFIVAAMDADEAAIEDAFNLQVGPEKAATIIDQTQLRVAVGVNWRSADFTDAGYPAPIPGHIDYLKSGIRPDVLMEKWLIGNTLEETNRACRFFCRRRLTAAGYGKHHWEWISPLVHYFDPDAAYQGFPRKLRTYDVVSFVEDGVPHPVLLTSCNPLMEKNEGGDLCQLAHYEGWELPVPLSY